MIEVKFCLIYLLIFHLVGIMASIIIQVVGIVFKILWIFLEHISLKFESKYTNFLPSQIFFLFFFLYFQNTLYLL